MPPHCIPMKSPRILHLFAALMLAAQALPAAQPNVLFIIADDHCY